MLMRSLEHVPFYDVAGPLMLFLSCSCMGQPGRARCGSPNGSPLRRVSGDPVDLPEHGTLRDQPFQLASAVRLIVESLGQETNGRAARRALAWGIGAMATASAQVQKIAGLFCLDAVSIIVAPLACFLDSTASW